MVQKGEPVASMRNGKLVADLVRHREAAGRRSLGAPAGTVDLPQGWDAPMSEEQAARFIEGESW